MKKHPILKRACLALPAVLLSLLLICAPQASAATAGQRIAHRKMVVSQMVEKVQSAYYTIRESLNTLIPTSMGVCVSVQHYEIEELIEQSNVIATGHFTGRSDAFRVQSVQGGIHIYTDSFFAIDSVLKGEPYGDTVNVRSPGGTVGTFTQNWNSTLEFDERNTYLLFLYHPEPGGFHTAGDYYYVRGVHQGIYIQRADGSLYNPFSTEELPAEALNSPKMNENFTEEDQRNELMEIYRENYETGCDTWEEYQKNLAEMDQYAVILD